MEELHQAMSSGNARGMVGLTFDDAYKDFLYTALPILERFGFSATVFAVAGRIGGDSGWKHYHEPQYRMKLLGGEELREVSERGVEVGAHGMSHVALAGLEAQSLEEEVKRSHQVLSEVLGEAVEGFCYPYGVLDRAAVEAVRGARRYAYACAVHERVERGVYDLPRIPIAEPDHVGRFAAKLAIYSRYRRLKRAFVEAGAAP